MTRLSSSALPLSLPSLSLLLLSLSSSRGLRVPRVESYARVSTNGASLGDERILRERGEARAFQAVSPVYVPAAAAAAAAGTRLRNGEALEHRRGNDAEMLAASRNEAQDRFHPPASFERAVAHSNDPRIKLEKAAGSPSSDSKKASLFPVPSYATLPREVYATSYEPETDSREPPDSGIGIYGAGSGNAFVEQVADSYSAPSFGDDPEHQHYAHDFQYDEEPPEYYFHHHRKPSTTTTTTTTTTTSTTEQPEINDQRLSKRPYSYYYIGKKLWYLPLYFSIYFIIYVAALVLKSITRHKINFPASLAALANEARSFDGRSTEPPIDRYRLTERVLDALDLYNGVGKSRDS